MFMHERIQQKLEELNLKQADIARATGKSTAAVTKWLKGDNIPKAENLKAIAKLLNVSDVWLLTGNESALPVKNKDGQQMDGVKFRSVEFWDSETPLDDDEFEVPCYKDVELTGGFGSFEQHDDGRRRIKYGKTAAYTSGASQTQSICMTLVGDSMEDRIAAGSMIAVDLSKKDIREGKIYAFRHGQLLRVKYLIPKPDGGLIIRSHNKAYEDEHISTEEVENDINLIGWVWNWSVLERW